MDQHNQHLAAPRCGNCGAIHTSPLADDGDLCPTCTTAFILALAAEVEAAAEADSE